MKMNNFKLYALVALLIVGFPGTSSASSAIQVSDTTILYTIDITLEDAEVANEIPIQAVHGVGGNERVDYLGYTVASKRDTKNTLKAVNGVMVSKNKIAGTRYEVPKGVKSDFTLLVLATFNEPLKRNSYQARITKFPYFRDGKRTTMHQNQLDELDAPALVVK